ncbi:MAG: gamma-glutamyl-gamma-aminobutyrate hydrolase family protein [Acidobacteriota bacterium]|nr:gamma-glutamyl-gamma-aminobutyrate hydrolase family protein [Acidobacteriota bacterium]
MRHELETERFYLARYYGEAVEAAGGAPVHISLIPERGYVRSVAERLDGVLLPGSASDVDPARYGRDPLPRLGPVHPLKDETDALLLAEAERLGLPLFAICFGMQVWNVVRGGTLIQDIETQLPGAIKHEQGAPRERRSHRVRFLEGSFVGGQAGAGEAFVNSHHHQALETVGQNLRATAWASDGLVEAIEETRPGRWGVGVQWHPEIDWRGDELSERLFQSFVAAATMFASRRGQVAVSS